MAKLLIVLLHTVCDTYLAHFYIHHHNFCGVLNPYIWHYLVYIHCHMFSHLIHIYNQVLLYRVFHKLVAEDNFGNCNFLWVHPRHVLRSHKVLLKANREQLLNQVKAHICLGIWQTLLVMMYLQIIFWYESYFSFPGTCYRRILQLDDDIFYIVCLNQIYSSKFIEHCVWMCFSTGCL